MNRKSFLKSIAALLGVKAVAKAANEPKQGFVNVEPTPVQPTSLMPDPEQWKINPEWEYIDRCPACLGYLPKQTDFGTFRFIPGCHCKETAAFQRIGKGHEARMHALHDEHELHLRAHEFFLNQHFGPPTPRK
jgi:hypothetical protein